MLVCQPPAYLATLTTTSGNFTGIQVTEGPFKMQCDNSPIAGSVPRDYAAMTDWTSAARSCLRSSGQGSRSTWRSAESR